MAIRLSTPLLGVGVLLAATFAATAYGRFGAAPPEPLPVVQLAASDMRFEDAPDGGVLVRDLRGVEIDTLPPGTNGFVRGTLRGLVRERRRGEHDFAMPFRVQSFDDGRLVLTDLATGRAVDLKAFGPTNAEVFARLLARAEGIR